MPPWMKVIRAEPVPEFLVSLIAAAGTDRLPSRVAVELVRAAMANTVTAVPTDGFRYVPDGSS